MKNTPSKLPSSTQTGIIHFIGIGGIGMSALAIVLRNAGYTVQGSDLNENANTQRLNDMGVRTFKGHSKDNLGVAKTVIYSSAVKSDNPEFSGAKEKELTMLRRGTLLAQIAASRKTIAVAGTHGKTSTTAVVWSLLKAGGIDAGVINGGIINALGSNAYPGSSEWLAIETDESDGSFTEVSPQISIITNMDPEHLESYNHDVETHDAAYEQFCEQTKEKRILCIDHPKTAELAKKFPAETVITYGLAEGANVRATNIKKEGLFTNFTVNHSGGTFDVTLSALPGTHYVQNSLAAISAALIAGVSEKDIQEGLANFQGVGRRFTPVGYFNRGFVVDDYAHHPVEIKATLNGAKGSYKGKIFAVIQPHRYTRLRDLMQEFTTCAESADEVVLAPVYSAGEEPISGVSHTELARRMMDGGHHNRVHLIEDVESLRKFLSQRVKENDLVLCMGAGTISQWARDLVMGEAG